MKYVFSKVIIIFLLLNIGAANAERYQGDKKDLPKLDNIINVLNVQQQELQRLVSMLERLEAWKTSLTQSNMSLAKEGDELKQDKKKSKNGEMASSEYKNKWEVTSRSLKYADNLVVFQEDVKKFNLFVKEYNVLALKMNHVLSKRSPQQVGQLIKEMRRLVSNMQAALKGGEIEKAKFMAQQSDAAAEFGYVAN